MTIGILTDDMDDFYDTAACIANLDLVISVDTAVAHLAAAMGKETWVLSRYDCCWRWFNRKTETPWYPNMKLFYQDTWGDWDSCIEKAAKRTGGPVYD